MHGLVTHSLITPRRTIFPKLSGRDVATSWQLLGIRDNYGIYLGFTGRLLPRTTHNSHVYYPVTSHEPRHTVYRFDFTTGEEHTIRLQVRYSQNYPLDLYYVTDLSNSTSDDLKILIGLGNTLGMCICTIEEKKTCYRISGIFENLSAKIFSLHLNQNLFIRIRCI